MSRLAKRPIAIPAKTEISVSGNTLTVKGPKGTLTRPTNKAVSIEVGAEGVQVAVKNESLEGQGLVGSFASHVRKMVEGVSASVSKKLLV